MISSKEELIKYIEMDKKALGVKGKKPKIIGDDIWKFEIVLRKHEYYKNTNCNLLLRKVYGFLHMRLGYKLGFSIPCNVFLGVTN